MEAQSQLLSLSSCSQQMITQKSGHYIHLDKPELVVHAIRCVVEMAQREV